MRYDCLVIGAGPAGLSAAITLKIRNKNVAVMSNNSISSKVEKGHEINNYLGFPAIKGSDLAKHFEEHIKQLEVERINDQALTVYAMGDYFSISTKDNEMYEATSVIIATGIDFGKPYDGEEQYLGRGVSYCATCDARLYKGKKVVVIGGNKEAEEEAVFLSEIVEAVTYIPTYNEDSEFEAKESTKPVNLTVLRDIPLKITGGLKAGQLELKNTTLSADGFFILRDSVMPSQLVPGLVLDGNHIAVNRKMETSIPGCMACGDITGGPYQYIKAAGEGNVAALSVVDYINKLNKFKESK